MALARITMTLAAAAALAGCASPETRLRDGLERAGLRPPLAACMAGRMADWLSLLQLRRIAAIPGARDAESLDQLLHRLRALDDPEIVRVTATSAGLCTAGLG